jgi:hypothetical protein
VCDVVVDGGKVLCFLARVRGDFFAHEAARKTFKFTSYPIDK